MANRRISVYIPQTNPLTCPIDTFLLYGKRKNPAFQLTCSPKQKVEKSGIPSVA